MGLFDKKFCDICGAQIKLLGNKKLEDGNCCKDCASKLSPWFNERRHSTVDSIKEQLEYREANKAEVANFNVTRTIGDHTKVLIDENQKKFIITSSSKWRDNNPDVVSFANVTGCDTRIDESKHEEKKKTQDGKEISYIPPHFEYNYNFHVTVHVNNPFFDDMSFRLNNFSVEEKAIGPLLRHGAEYENYASSLEELKSIFLGIREEHRASVEAANAPKVPVKCPSCGATTLPDAKGCCEWCGSALN